MSLPNEQIVTPWEVSCNEETGVDYKKIINHFGCSPIEQNLLEEIKKQTNSELHELLRRKLVFAHRDFDKIISKKFYIYTGRGPSSESMHLGHAIPFVFTKYLQETFNAPLVIQMTDDEKFLFTKKSFEEIRKFTFENIKDILAFNFSKKTFIFSNFDYSHKFEENTLKIAKSISLNEAEKVFGFNGNSNIGQVFFPAKEIAPCFSSSFKFIKDFKHCLVPAAIDQDPYFRLARDKAPILKENKPSTIYSKFMPSLKGIGKKMSASDQFSAVFLTDTSEEIKQKITKHAFSGGKQTLKEHRKEGGNTQVDIPFIYLNYLLKDDQMLFSIKNAYENGEMLSSEMKNLCVKEVQKFVLDYQISRKEVNDDVVERFMSEREF
ncbi:tryptophan-tRNA ligase [Tubulinosema ratisbonensis]|uniref:tryptophan--tRNA ligase n=1 Tax=Tubulinosema ratisbonensis TaxID=291195 RepID=A0A437AHS6_9MICR|nr:tryptophan-tRNA ligase [Tubulinosema ratisbonensis]